MNIGKLLGKGVKLIKAHPEKVLVVVSLVAPGLAARIAPKVVPIVLALGKKSEG